jgi:CheY-like chemotaxis protein/two-component sensor histidine kinase
MDDLLDVSRVTSGKVTLQRSLLDLRDVARKCVETLEPLLRSHGHDLDVSLGDEPLGVHGDPVRIEQMLSNLITNAIKYTPRGGKIQVRAGAEEGQAVISVKDSGVGIDSATLPYIFDLFAQGPASLERSQGGLGIGLTLVKRLVEMHGGSVEARSEGLGCGSEFTLRFPLEAIRSEAKSPAEPAGPPKEGTARKILIIEDNEDNRNTLRALLACMGHEVDVAQDGMLGIERARAFQPEVALIDIGLPGLNGYRVAETLRTEPWGDRMVLIALTGYGQSEDRRRAFEAGFDAHLVKPVSFENLLSILDTARTS